MEDIKKMKYDTPILTCPLCYIEPLGIWATIYEYEPENYFAYIRQNAEDTAIVKTIKFTSLYDDLEAIKEDFITAYREA